jgi:signal transduction histidine kinase
MVSEDFLIFPNSHCHCTDEAPSEREPLSTAVDCFSNLPERGNCYSRNAVSNLRRTTFSRASNLVREGMEVDGAVYFDAPAGNNSLSLSESGSSSADEDYADVRPSLPSHAMHSANPSMLANGRAEHAIDEAAGLESNVLGFSTRKHSSFKGENRDNTDAFSVMDQNLLVSLVRRYPEGKRFAFGHHGTTPHQVNTAATPRDITVSMKHKRDRHKARKRAEIIRLLAIFPGARQIFFVPLYDSMFECFIGSFTWSTSSTRIFSTENDLSYLVAFGHSVMTELGRLNMLSADRAKDQFINNVSHELRSPLHGILASAEFLAGTSIDGFQRSLVDNVDDCGHTLLDTIEHILDFSKVKNFGKGIKQSLGVAAEVDISAIIEEALEGVCAGFDIHGLFSRKLADMTENSNGDAPDMSGDTLASKNLEASVAKDIPAIILDIDFSKQWKFHTVPGTWRRLIMNLFGNALKFTPKGWIKVKLETRKISPLDLIQNDGKERTIVTLIISDSGRGISGDFMKTKLFMPFCQVLGLREIVTCANSVQGGRYYARDWSRNEYCKANS